MTLARALLNAKHIGVKELRSKLSFSLHRTPVIVTEYGEPKGVLMSYDDAMEIVDILDELTDKESVSAVWRGRKAMARNPNGIPFKFPKR